MDCAAGNGRKRPNFTCRRRVFRARCDGVSVSARTIRQRQAARATTTTGARSASARRGTALARRVSARTLGRARSKTAENETRRARCFRRASTATETNRTRRRRRRRRRRRWRCGELRCCCCCCYVGTDVTSCAVFPVSAIHASLDDVRIETRIVA